jgi:hypothetical protein
LLDRWTCCVRGFFQWRDAGRTVLVAAEVGAARGSNGMECDCAVIDLQRADHVELCWQTGQAVGGEDLLGRLKKAVER